jgi:hypothetical protein
MLQHFCSDIPSRMLSSVKLEQKWCTHCIAGMLLGSRLHTIVSCMHRQVYHAHHLTTDRASTAVRSSPAVRFRLLYDI